MCFHADKWKIVDDSLQGRKYPALEQAIIRYRSDLSAVKAVLRGQINLTYLDFDDILREDVLPLIKPLTVVKWVSCHVAHLDR